MTDHSLPCMTSCEAPKVFNFVHGKNWRKYSLYNPFKGNITLKLQMTSLVYADEAGSVEHREPSKIYKKHIHQKISD